MDTIDVAAAGDAVDQAEMRRAAAAVLESATFSRTKRGRELLAYLIDMTLAGRQDEIKAFSIACDVFGRDQNFDADNDALVRVQAARVRTLLAEFYAKEGAGETLRITLPKGGYVPVFESTLAFSAPASDLQAANDDAPVAGDDATASVPEPAGDAISEAPASAPGGYLLIGVIVIAAALAALLFASRPADFKGAPVPNTVGTAAVTDGSISVMAAPFVKFSPEVSDRSLEFIRSKLLQLSQMSFVTIFSDKAARADGEDVDPMEVARRRGIHYLLEGRVLGAEGALRVNIDLLDVASGKYVWTQSYEQAAGATIDDFTLSIMSSLHFVLMRAASSNAQEINLDSAKPWDLYFLANWINGNWRSSLAWEKERVALARRAIAKDPHFAPAYSLLASKLAFLANVDPASDTPQTHAEAHNFAREALENAQGDADVAFNVGLYHWYSGQTNDAILLMKRTLDLAPHHPLARFLVTVIPYNCASVPESAIDQLIAYDSSVPPNSAVRWVTLGWVALLYLNNGDFAHAAEYGKRSYAVFHTPDNMFRLAVALAHVGEAREARELIEDQRVHWPSLDPQHYAEVVIPRRCGHAPKEAFLRGLYLDLVSTDAGQAGASPPRASLSAH